jgi:hypothetical protein
LGWKSVGWGGSSTEGGGSPTSLAVAVGEAAVGEAAEAAEEAARPTTTFRASLLWACLHIPCTDCRRVYFSLFFNRHVSKKILKNPRPACNYLYVVAINKWRRRKSVAKFLVPE